LSFSLVYDFFLQSKDLSHFLSKLSKTNGCIIVDGEPQIIWVVNREQTLIVFSHFFLLELLSKVIDSHILSQVFQKYLQKHSGSSSCGIGCQPDHLKDLPIQNLSPEQM
jgi:hypothetical protein